MSAARLLLAAPLLLTALGCALPEHVPEGGFEVVAELDVVPGNVAVTPTGRVVISQHPFGAPELRVVEVLADGSTAPFPTDAWSRAPTPGSDVGLHSVLGIESDARGVVWMLDLGPADGPARLVAWDTRVDALHRVIEIPAPVKAPNSFVQDLAVDLVHDAVYLADMGRADPLGESVPAILVVDLVSGASRRVLHGHPVLQPEPDAEIVIDGRRARLDAPDRPSPSNGLNPITLDAAGRTLYFGAMNGRTLYRVATADLRDASLDDDALAARVERHGTKPVSDGISIDTAGNVYVTDLNDDAIGVVDATGRYRVLHRDDELVSWPDGISFGPDGMGYVTVNQLHLHAPLNGGVDATHPPFRVLRFRPITRGVLGR